MSDEIDTVDNNDSDDESRGPVAGQRLADARREQQIPLIDIAKELHLDEQKVRALENNEFDVIGAPVFAKGHLRKYAQLVSVDVSDIMADYYQLERQTAAPLLVHTRPKVRRELSPGPWLAVVGVLLIVAAAYWWFAGRALIDSSPARIDVAPLPQPSIELPADDDRGSEIDLPAADAEMEAGPALDAHEPAEEPAIAAEPPAAAEAVTDVSSTLASGEMRITIQYSGDCWSEISDASGRRLFFDLGKAGRTVNLVGEAPFNALFGNANNVSITVNGAAFEIPAASRRGRTARLTINGS